MGMRVGELARRTGVGVSTLRAWEGRFHFLEPDRSASGHRLYDEADVGRVEAVVRLVAEGLTLAAAIARVSGVGTGALPTGEGEALLFGQILHTEELPPFDLLLPAVPVQSVREEPAGPLLGGAILRLCRQVASQGIEQHGNALLMSCDFFTW